MKSKNIRWEEDQNRYITVKEICILSYVSWLFLSDLESIWEQLFWGIAQLPTRLKSGVFAGKLMNLFILVLKPSTVCFIVSLWSGIHHVYIYSTIYLPLLMGLPLSQFSLPLIFTSLRAPATNMPPRPQSESSTCMHHSNHSLVSVRHNRGWRSIFVSSHYKFCAMLSEL